MLKNRYWIAFATAVLAIGVVSTDAEASSASLKSCSRCRLLSGWGMGTVPETAFNADKIKTIQGEVVSVQDLPSEGEVVGGVYVLLKTDTGDNVAVRLGPSSYVLGSGLSIEPYDALTITGSEIDSDDHKGIIATQVRKGGDTVHLRSNGGSVAWR